MEWIIGSIVLSLILTIVLNVGVRAFPRASERAAGRFDRWTTETAAADDRRVRVYFPWKAMLIASVVLTIVLNLVARL